MPIRRPLRVSVPVLVALALAAPALAQTDFGKVQIRATELAPGVHALEGAGGTIGVSAGEDGVILIDDQYAPLTDKILFAVRQISDQPIRFVINTHFHGDHTGGNENFGGMGAWLVAHDNVRTRMSTEQFNRLFNRRTPPSPAGAWPVVTFSDNMQFFLNDHEIHVFHVENAHTDGDAIVHFRNRNVIHMGDCFWNGNYPFIDVGAGGSLRGLIRAADAALLLADGSTKIVPGHGAVGGRAELRAYRDMLAEALSRIEPLVVAGQTADEIARAKPMAEFDATWGGGFIDPDRFVQSVVDDLSR